MSDSAEHKRAAGKQAVQARIIWELRIGEVGFRCLHNGMNRIVEERVPGQGWGQLTTGVDAVELLTRLVTREQLQKILAMRIHQIQGATQ